ncbi:GIY-YIG catalytic domain-containing protein [Micromonospora kangleipakensis]|uniref:GIY-YIG catalytic domain-containing protein n=1 Tax=Micromonospora kangleipakensis TaxID=1077942 RepID=A0A4Q8B7J3_9ACTN|nr:GIY-YIG nuclease family protein [Micromonospora kangleipakensis]RZU73642.1 GIY-YIG catalytic domain-containing protein [Micromonospora kangleipakensis]
MLDAEDLLATFTPPQPYTMEAAAGAPRSSGVHAVLDRGTVVYVGYTGNLRNRLRQHLTGSRDSSVLHEQVGHLLDKLGHEASAAEIADWLGQREVRWQETDNPEGTKETLVLALKPRFNRQVPKPRH